MKELHLDYDIQWASNLVESNKIRHKKSCIKEIFQDISIHRQKFLRARERIPF